MQRSRQRSIGMRHNARIRQPWTPSLSVSFAAFSLRLCLSFVLMQTISATLPNLITEEGGKGLCGAYIKLNDNAAVNRKHSERDARGKTRQAGVKKKTSSCHNMLGAGRRISGGDKRSLQPIIMSFRAARRRGVSLGKGWDRYSEGRF